MRERSCSLIFLVTLFVAWLASDFVPTPYELKLWPGLTIPPPLVTLCNANDVQDEQYVLFHRTHPHVVSLRRTYASLFPPPGFNNASFFWTRKTISFISSSMHWKFFMSRPAAALLDWRPLSCSPSRGTTLEVQVVTLNWCREAHLPIVSSLFFFFLSWHPPSYTSPAWGPEVVSQAPQELCSPVLSDRISWCVCFLKAVRFKNQNSDKSPFFFHESHALYVQTSSHTSWFEGTRSKFIQSTEAQFVMPSTQNCHQYKVLMCYETAQRITLAAPDTFCFWCPGSFMWRLSTCKFTVESGWMLQDCRCHLSYQW